MLVLVSMDAVVMLLTLHVMVTYPQGILQHVTVMLIAILLVIVVLMSMRLAAIQTLVVITFMLILKLYGKFFYLLFFLYYVP